MLANRPAQSMAWAARLCLGLIPAKCGATAITLHHVAANDLPWLARTLDAIQAHCDFACPCDLADVLTAKGGRKRILLTFDDGFRSNRALAEEVLEPRGIKATFFITQAFIGMDGPEAHKFAQEHFYPTRQVETRYPGEFDALDWADIDWLQKHGHGIGAHTATHVRVAGLSSAELASEVIESADRIQQRIGHPIRQFAYPFGSLACADEAAVEMVRTRFDFAFSNIRGELGESPDHHFLYRQNLVPGTPMWLVDAIVEGRLNWRYRKAQREAQARFSRRTDKK